MRRGGALAKPMGVRRTCVDFPLFLLALASHFISGCVFGTSTLEPVRAAPSWMAKHNNNNARGRWCNATVEVAAKKVKILRALHNAKRDATRPPAVHYEQPSASFPCTGGHVPS